MGYAERYMPTCLQGWSAVWIDCTEAGAVAEDRDGVYIPPRRAGLAGAGEDARERRGVVGFLFGEASSPRGFTSSRG